MEVKCVVIELRLGCYLLRDLGITAENRAVVHSVSKTTGCRGTQMLALIKVTLESAAP